MIRYLVAAVAAVALGGCTGIEPSATHSSGTNGTTTRCTTESEVRTDKACAEVGGGSIQAYKAKQEAEVRKLRQSLAQPR